MPKRTFYSSIVLCVLSVELSLLPLLPITAITNTVV